jgi:N-methylhydantoinase B
MIVLNVRHPRDFRGDLAAMIGSARVGERRLRELMAEFGSETTHAGVEAVLDGAERQVRAIISEWPNGIYEGEAFLDDDGHKFKDIRIHAKVTKSGSDLEVDLTESHEQVIGFINSSYANTHSAIVVALSYLIDPDIPKNDGAFRPLTVKLKEGTIVWPRPGAPVTLCTNHCGQEIMEAIIKALAPACPARAMAGWGRRFRIAITGTDPRTERPFIWHLFQSRPGGGASSAGDGWAGAGEWQAAGGIKFGSIEVHEVRFPLHFRRHEFRPDSGGDGQFRGGPGGILEMAIETATPAIGNTAGDGIKYGACGMNGGTDGQPHTYWLESHDLPDRPLKTKEVGVTIRPHDILHAHSGGGGGWGPPTARTPADRAADLQRGFVTERK